MLEVCETLSTLFLLSTRIKPSRLWYPLICLQRKVCFPCQESRLSWNLEKLMTAVFLSCLVSFSARNHSYQNFYRKLFANLNENSPRCQRKDWIENAAPMRTQDLLLEKIHLRSAWMDGRVKYSNLAQI